MVADGWSLSDVESFAKEYGITLNVTYEETDEYEEGKVIYQSRGIGDRIVKGITLTVKIAKAKEDPIDDILPSDNNNDNDNN